MRTLISLSYSPWSEKARWALDHHGVWYRREEYVPMLGEPWLRARTRRWRGRLGVPVLIDHGHVFADSLDIARRADALRSSESLFPTDAVAAIDEWNARSEAGLAAGRALLLSRLVDDPEALDESLPGATPPFARRALRPVTRRAVRYVASKYQSTSRGADEHRRTLIATLEELRRALAGRDTIVDTRFTYADIAMAVVLQMVVPVDERFVRLRPATRRVWTSPELAAAFPDLLAWRDQLYARHRGVRAK